MVRLFKSKRGFTLIELLVVVLIIGVLASIAVPQYFKVVERSRVSEAYSVISSIKSAQERYLAKDGIYTGDYTSTDLSYPNMTATNVPAQFYNAGLSGAGNCSGDPCYGLSISRHTGKANVATRYGTYAITVNVPASPVPLCNNANCNAELLD